MGATAVRLHAESAAFEPPYRAGWFDRLIDWIDRAPGPNFLYYVGLLMAQALYVTAVLWANGKMPVGTIDPPRLFLVVVTPYLLWVRFYLDRVARTALEDFRPALAVDDAQFLRLRYELTTLPPRVSRVVTAVAVVAFFINTTIVFPWIVEQYASSVPGGLFAMGPIGFSTLVVVALSMARAIHQLRMVGRLHDRATDIHLFRAKPLYAFSGLAARTGMSLVLLTYYIGAVRPDVVFGVPTLNAVFVGMIATAVACFVLPLRGIHRRIAAEKNRALGEAGLRLEGLIARLHERVDQGVLTDADKLNMQLTSIVTERAALMSVSTWPWEPATLTAFVTTMVLPAIVWTLQRVLTRFGL